MRKQTKVVAVASAAALLAIGASMTSFAATGWQEEDGVWYYYDNDGNRQRRVEEIRATTGIGWTAKKAALWLPISWLTTTAISTT